ncbi:MAG: hypothetical protein LUQ47_00735 [Methanotrichaceae archaeon]|nr:hypothetical protein [Methanotrichaceae archaeon]
MKVINVQIPKRRFQINSPTSALARAAALQALLLQEGCQTKLLQKGKEIGLAVLDPWVNGSLYLSITQRLMMSYKCNPLDPLIWVVVKYPNKSERYIVIETANTDRTKILMHLVES